MINPKQLRDLIARTLKEIPIGYSEDAVELLMMIAAHESRLGTYLRQVKGPALGIFQIEPTTHNDVWRNGDSINDNALSLGIHPCKDRLEYDLRYQVFIARQKLFMITEPLPSHKDEYAMGEYCKKYWNTEHGKATVEQYVDDYFEYAISMTDYSGEPLE